MLVIDGAHGEGGGQLVRTTIALAAVTHTTLRIVQMRARRPKPGLAPQHLTAVRAVAALCGGEVEGLTPGSQSLVFVPGELRGGTFEFDVGTAGSIPLVLQALMPAMVMIGRRVEVHLVGGTDIWAAPPLDYLEHVLLPLMRLLGARATLRCTRRGYYPRGGGRVELVMEQSTLVPRQLDVQGKLRSIRGVAHAANLPSHIPARMGEAATSCLAGWDVSNIEISLLHEPGALGAGGAIVLWAETDCTILGAGRVARRGVPAELLGQEAGSELAVDLASGATLDVHAADQMLVYFALSGGGSFLTRRISSHSDTTMWLIAQLLPVHFVCTQHGDLVHVAVCPVPPGQRDA